MSPKTQSGFTLIEIIIIISLLAIIAVIVLTGFQNFARFEQYNQAVADVQYVLRQARLDARSAVGDVAHGVKFGTNDITRFAGVAYSASDPDNIITSYQHVTLTPELTGGTDEIVFSILTGLPSATGTIMIEGLNFDSSSTIAVTEAGVIQ